MVLALHEPRDPRLLEARVRAAVDKVRPTLLEQGVDLELVGINEDTARVHVKAAGALHISPSALRTALEEAIGRGAPEIAAVAIEGLETSDVPLSRLRR